MPKREDFDKLRRPVPQPAGVVIGHPGRMGAVIDSENGQFKFGHNKIGIDRHQLHGDINIDGPDSLRQGIMGLPIQVYDNILGTIPSTMFTPTAAKLIGVDIEFMELALIGGLVLGLLGAV